MNIPIHKNMNWFMCWNTLGNFYFNIDKVNESNIPWEIRWHYYALHFWVVLIYANINLKTWIFYTRNMNRWRDIALHDQHCSQDWDKKKPPTYKGRGGVWDKGFWINLCRMWEYLIRATKNNSTFRI